MKKKYKIPPVWIPNPRIEIKASKSKIDPVFFQRTLAKFRKGYYYDGESLDQLFWRFLSKERETFRRRSIAQKARHHKRQMFAPPKRSDANYYKDLEKGRQAIAGIKELLSD